LADKEKKVRRQNAIQRYFTETSGELRKVSWPTRQEAVQLTILVVIVMVAMAIFLGLVDLAASKLLNLLLGV
jgi:preprotein translocase subunit SecE